MQYKEITYSKNIIIKNQANKQTNAKRKNCKKQKKKTKQKNLPLEYSQI